MSRPQSGRVRSTPISRTVSGCTTAPGAASPCSCQVGPAGPSCKDSRCLPAISNRSPGRCRRQRLPSTRCAGGWRLAIRQTGRQSFRVTSYYGFSAPIGGGQYERGDEIRGEPTAIVGDPNDPARAGDSARPSTGCRLLRHAGRRARRRAERVEPGRAAPDRNRGQPSLSAGAAGGAHPSRCRLVIRAANDQRPTLRLPADFVIDGASGSALELNGLLIGDRALSIGGTLDELEIAHCTFVPGLDARCGRRPGDTGGDVAGDRRRRDGGIHPRVDTRRH